MDNQQGPALRHMEPLLIVTWQPGWEGSLEQNGYVWLSLFAVHRKLSQRC